MTIKTVSLWAKTLETYVPATMAEIKEGTHHPEPFKAWLDAQVAAGKISATPGPGDEVIETPEGIQVTLVWNDATAAQELYDLWFKPESPGLISGKVVID